MNEYQDTSFQCTGSEAALTDCPETGLFSCEADNADFAMAVRCGGVSGGGRGNASVCLHILLASMWSLRFLHCLCACMHLASKVATINLVTVLAAPCMINSRAP